MAGHPPPHWLHDERQAKHKGNITEIRKYRSSIDEVQTNTGEMRRNDRKSGGEMPTEGLRPRYCAIHISKLKKGVFYKYSFETGCQKRRRNASFFDSVSVGGMGEF